MENVVLQEHERDRSRATLEEKVHEDGEEGMTQPSIKQVIPDEEVVSGIVEHEGRGVEVVESVPDE